MALDSTERLLVRIIMACIVGIIYLLAVKYHGNFSDVQPGDDSFSIAAHKTSIKDHEINSHQIRDNSPNARVSPSSNEWIYHRQKVHFIHPALSLESIPNHETAITVSAPERFGIFALDHIPFGTILSVEDPIFSASFVEEPHNLGLRVSYIDRIVKEHIKQYPEFKRFWKSLPVHPLQRKRLLKMLKSINEFHPKSAMNNYVRFATHKIASHRRPRALYSVIGRLGFNLPQNAMVVIGDNDKAVLISTTSIQKGEEIVMDHFCDWLSPHFFETENIHNRRDWAGDRGFDLNEKWIAFFKRLRDDSSTTEQKNEMLLEMYPNGLVGKDANQKFTVMTGCKGLESSDCNKKDVMTKIIGSGAIFEEFDAKYLNESVHETACDGLQI